MAFKEKWLREIVTEEEAEASMVQEAEIRRGLGRFENDLLEF